MNFNSLFFPAPRGNYSIVSHFGEIIYVPKVIRDGKHVLAIDDYKPEGEVSSKLIHIPCLYIQKRIVKPSNENHKKLFNRTLSL